MGITSTLLTGKYHPDVLVKNGGIIINDIPATVDAHTDFKSALICTVEGSISIDASCQCGVTRQPRHSILPNECPVCHTDPADKTSDDLVNLIYLRTPIGVDKLVITNFWNQMRVCFTRGHITGKGISILRWVTDPAYVIKDKAGLLIINYLKANGIKRGYNNFIRNMDEYLIIMSKEPTTFNTKDIVKDLLIYYKRNKNKIFTNHIPFMDKITRVMEKSISNKRAADGFVSVIDAIMGVTSIDDSTYTEARREAITARFMENYTIYWDHFLGDTIQGKYGFIRGTLFRARGTRNSRLVLSSITEPHNYSHIQMPWVAMIYNLETPITSILLKRGMTMAQVKDFIQHCYSNHNTTMERVIDKIIKDCRSSLPCTILRYPSLTRSSKLFMDAGDYKKIPNDYTVSMSPLAVRALNA